MGKADLLKKGAQRTGSGLFKGMTPLETRDDAVSVENKKTEVVEKTVKATEPVIEKPEPISEPIKIMEPVIEKQEGVAEESDKIEAPVEEIKTQANDISNAKEEKREIKSEINIAEKSRKTAETKTNSRYEKEKFLLLDIRGLRDYVEHMAKAANMSATKYIRNLIQQDMDKNMDIYEAHKALEEMLKGRAGG